MSGSKRSSAGRMTDKSIRCGVFHTIQEADRAIQGLLAAGFTHDEISVVCSEAAKERHFQEYVHEEPAGSHTPRAAAAGSAIGLIVGGLVTLGVSTLTGVPLVAAGPSFLGGGAISGGFIGAMLTRAEEGEMADFYDQALTRGDLLVGVEDHGPDNAVRLAKAAEVFREAGAKPLPLEGDA